MSFMDNEITEQDIEALRADAGQHGDEAMVRLCDEARQDLRDRRVGMTTWISAPHAVRLVAEALSNARAQHEAA